MRCSFYQFGMRFIAFDKQRMETLEDCIEVDGFLKLAYREKGYNLIEVPRVSVEERVAFIEAHL